MFAKIFCFFLSIFVAIEAQFVIDRGEQDVFRNLTGCSEETPDFCYFLHSDKSQFDPCVCRCWPKYPMYRDHDVFPVQRGQFKSKGKPGCVWHSNHRYECFHIRKLGRGRDTNDDEEALEFDLSKPGSLQTFADHDLSTCTGLETAIKMPEDSVFTPKTGLLTAVYGRFDILNFMWTRSAERYDGGLLRGVFTGCPEKVKEAGRCFVGKITGVYNGGECTVRALNGECCILPFKYNGQVYNNCTRAGGSKEAWCAVRLPFLGNETNWRQDCTNSSKVAPSSSLIIQSSPTISISQPPTESVAATRTTLLQTEAISVQRSSPQLGSTQLLKATETIKLPIFGLTPGPNPEPSPSVSEGKETTFSSNIPGVKLSSQFKPMSSIDLKPTPTAHEPSTSLYKMSSTIDQISSTIDYISSIIDYKSSVSGYSPTVIKYTSSVIDYEPYNQTSSTIDHRSYEISPSSNFMANSIDFTSSVSDYKSSVKISMINYTSSIIDTASSVTVPARSTIDYTSSIIDYKPSVPGYSPSVVNYTSSVSDYKSYSDISSTIDHRSSINYTSSIIDYEITPSSALMAMSINFTSSVSDYKSSVKLSMINYTSSIIDNVSSVIVPTQSTIDYTLSTSDNTSSIIDHVSSVTVHPKQPITDYTLSANHYTPSIIDHVSSMAVPEQSKTDHMQSSIDYTSASFASKLSMTVHRSRISDYTSSMIDHVSSVIVPEQSKTDHTQSSIDYTSSSFTSKLSMSDHRSRMSAYTSSIIDQVSSVAVPEQSKTDHMQSSIDYTSASFASKLSMTDHKSKMSDYTSSISVYKTTVRSSKRTMSTTINQYITKPSFTTTMSMSPQTVVKPTNTKVGSSMSSAIASDPKATASDPVAVVIIIVIATVAFVVLSLVCCLFIGLRLWKNRTKKYKVINKKPGEQAMQSPATQRPDTENPVQTHIGTANESENEITETEFTIPEKNDKDDSDEKYPSFMTFRL